MDDTFEGNTTYYNYDDPIKEKYKFNHIDSNTGVSYRVSISYEYNADVVDAIENKLLRSHEYSLWPRKLDILLPLCSSQLENIRSKLYPTVTGLQFRTLREGQLTWTILEDTDEIAAFVPLENICTDIPKVNITALSAFRRLGGFAYLVNYLHEPYVFKFHGSPLQNDVFRAELFARLAIGNIPHVLGLTAIVTQENASDEKPYVAGMLMKYCSRGDLHFLLSRPESRLDWGRKTKWAAQITHGIMGIHQAGIIHGDLRCSNVVVDENDDAHIIDIIDGNGYTEDWTCMADKGSDPRRDVYSLGVTFWEIACDGEQPVHPLRSLGMDTFDQVVKSSVVDDASQRAGLDHLFYVLGGKVVCGCLEGTRT